MQHWRGIRHKASAWCEQCTAMQPDYSDAWANLASARDNQGMTDESNEACPWYPSARLFRQTTPGDWEGVIERVGQALRELI